MALADCTIPTTLDSVDTTLQLTAVGVSAATLISSAQRTPALAVSWAAGSNPYVLGAQFQYVDHAGADGAVLSPVLPIALGSASLTQGLVAGKGYDVQYRAVGASPWVGPWVVAGLATLSDSNAAGGLAQGGDISVGGSTNLPVSCQPYTLGLSDGDVVTFSPTYPSAPLVQFTSPGLVALTTGQSYFFNAESLSGSGFTARIKVRTPSSPSYTTQVDGPTTVQTAFDDWEMDKSLTTDAYNGYYTFRAKGTFRVFKQHISGEPDDYQGGMTLGCWVRAAGAGAWTEIGTLNVGSWGLSSGSHSFDVSKAIYTGIAIGQGAGTEFKLTVDSRWYTSTDDFITEFTSVSYTYQSGGGAPTDTSATPNGEKCAVYITPPNV